MGCEGQGIWLLTIKSQVITAPRLLTIPKILSHVEMH